ncbi:MAG: N-acetyltransferase [Treponema sp.]|nr:N-acetyltransferase [Treponema sp.]
MKVTIRRAEPADAEALLAIYAYYVQNTAVSFEYEVPSVAEFTERIRGTLVNYPYLVAERDGKAVGYIYAGRFSGRAAYDWAAETSIYIAKDCHRIGLGKLLYEKLEQILAAQHVTNVYAGIAVPAGESDPHLTRDSEHFHAAIGYTTIARFTGCGNKFATWYNLIYMEKIIGEHRCPPEAFIPFSQLNTGAFQL